MISTSATMVNCLSEINQQSLAWAILKGEWPQQTDKAAAWLYG